MSNSEDSDLAQRFDHIYRILEIGEMFAAVLTPEEQSILPRSDYPTIEEMYLEMIRIFLNT